MSCEPIAVYLVDDHAMVREGLASILAKHPSIRVVGQSGDGTAALEEIQRCRPDVAVVDISLPGLSGLDVCRELHRTAKHVTVLMLTIHSDDQFIVRALREGAAGYVLKDSAAEDLAEAITRVARGELHLGPGVPSAVLGRVLDDTDPYDLLSKRERQVLRLIADGKTSREVANRLGLAVKTVDTHRSRLMGKLNIHDQTALVKYAIRKGIIALDGPARGTRRPPSNPKQ